jgi:hypothetical protein
MGKTPLVTVPTHPTLDTEAKGEMPEPALAKGDGLGF